MAKETQLSQGGAGGGYVFNPQDFVRITNMDSESVVRGKQVIHGRFDGKNYVFPFEQPVDVHIEVARHVFGFGLDDKSSALNRLGWATRSDMIDSALERLKNIRFDDLPQLMEVPRAKGGRNKTGSASTLGKASDPEGADLSAPDGPADAEAI